jgi:hypothetical protein
MRSVPNTVGNADRTGEAMKSIQTKYLGPSNIKGSRVVADDGDGNRITLTWRSELDSEDNHAEAAIALCKRMGWSGRLQGGDILKGGKTVGMVWVWVDKRVQISITKKR